MVQQLNKVDSGPARAKRAAGPRSPARDRGLVRFNALVDATETLLETGDPDEIGLYQIAEEAGIPPASAYHFFPTKEAAFTAVAMRISERLMDVHREPILAERVLTWQGLFRNDVERARQFYNSQPAGLKILYGGFGGVDGRNVDRAVTSRLAVSGYSRLNKIFHMPYLRHPERKLENRMGILDAIWSISVRKHGTIDDDHFEESLFACIAYSRTFLPDRVEPREELLEAARQGETILLPFDAPLDET